MPLATEHEDALSLELEPDEPVRWTGRPMPLRQAIRALPVPLIALPFFGLAALTREGMLDDPGSDGAGGDTVTHFVLFVLVAIGISLLIWPAFVFLRNRWTSYAITDRRALIVRGWRRPRVDSFERPVLRRTLTLRRRDGSGDLVFDRWLGDEHYGFMPVGLLALHNVDTPQALIREIALQSSLPPWEPEVPHDYAHGAFWAILIGLLFVGMSGWAIWTGGRTATLVCTRPAPGRASVVIQEQWLGLIDLAQTPVPEIRSAEMVEDDSISNGGPFCQIVLRTAADPVRVGYNTGIHRLQRQRIVQQLNDFLRRPTPASLTLAIPSRGLSLIVPLILLVAGLLVILLGCKILRISWRN